MADAQLFPDPNTGHESLTPFPDFKPMSTYP